MSPFPESEIPIKVVKCTCSSHPDAMWPLYLYHLNSSPNTNNEKNNHHHDQNNNENS